VFESIAVCAGWLRSQSQDTAVAVAVTQGQADDMRCALVECLGGKDEEGLGG